MDSSKISIDKTFTLEFEDTPAIKREPIDELDLNVGDLRENRPDSKGWHSVPRSGVGRTFAKSQNSIKLKTKSQF